MKNSTWIVYKTESKSAPGWEERKLSPRGSLTNILWENWSHNDNLPQVGDRIRDYENLTDPGNGVTDGKDGDWVVTRMHHFSSFDTDERIVVCYCQFQPANADWERLKRGTPVNEMLSPA